METTRHARRLALAFCAWACLLNLALGQLETRSTVPGATSPFALAAGDFNGDGRLDFASAANNLQIFLGNGNGTFQPPANYLTGTGALFVSAADLNGDKKLDLAVADLNGLDILMGNGDGTFQSPVLYTTACIPIFAATGDFNGDKKIDLLVTYSSGTCGYVSIFLGNGDGTFQASPINSFSAYNPAAVGIGDFNGDGKPDIAVAEQFGTISQVEVMLGNGDGTFAAGNTYPVASSPNSVAVADFRSNGKLDLAVSTLTGVTNILLGNGDGTFHPGGTISTPDADWALSADFNGDGKPDLAVATQGSVGLQGGVNLALGNGDGTFQAPTFYPAGTNDRFLGSGDFNGDKKIDLLIPDYRYNDIIVLLNTGVVDFSPTTPLNYPFQTVNTTSAPQSVTLTNSGAAALSISSFKVTGPFHQTNNCGKSLAAGAKCKIEVTFTPTASGSVSGTVSISDSASSKPQVIDLTGAGTFAALSPLALTFPGQKVGTKSPPQNITLTNKGSSALSIKLIYLGGPEYQDYSESNNCPSSLNAGANCTISVTFDPKKTGKRNAAVYVEDNSGGRPQYVTLTGTGD